MYKSVRHNPNSISTNIKENIQEALWKELSKSSEIRLLWRKLSWKMECSQSYFSVLLRDDAVFFRGQLEYYSNQWNIYHWKVYIFVWLQVQLHKKQKYGFFSDIYGFILWQFPELIVCCNSNNMYSCFIASLCKYIAVFFSSFCVRITWKNE